MSKTASASWFAEKIGNRTMKGIAQETRSLIRVGTLPVGTKLPAIRDLAFELGVSPATISEAWSDLRRQKIITGRGRNGTFVSADSVVAKPERLASAGHYGPDVLDLSVASPDTALLPSLAGALAHGARAEGLNSYERNRILPELEEAVRESWPYDPGAFLVTNGGYNAVYTLLHALVRPGSAVAIEDPTAMRLLDILEDLGVEILPVACDAQGPLPASLANALARKPAAFLFQPRLHSVTGRTVSRERLDVLAGVLAGTSTLIVEDDGVGDISTAPRQTLGARFPDRVIHILSYSKTLGPDLRLAVLSSSAAIVEEIQSYRSFSSGWTSRILQGATAWLLRDPETEACLARARAIYRERRERVAAALERGGIRIEPAGDGLCVWMPVASESYALVTLAARGIAVHAGAKFSVAPTPFVRVATARLAANHERVADALRTAARS
ncbi:PLP-dependent aminotransferase family protein [Aureimonas jatrophae]|uniref:DNA-binding transcriptional regulator, MocR family, contains an aminotransferase domain n=1 Tax=Aureimonas jatrophae TaxID=1166073 RepID=A0A1H0FMB6_9HYPH|nr:aminotransferase class I/II-fold pyridoxal phosphate-dependent enzyme [Aureimonas jatrophae]MBB3949948.1 DNA-binding transcriptional MocR family regulator [Aureimonas jatrophae]SDN95775.1 DNA-binding transcriptional regulator, MocR family, contains an aminotransferase domain [Aureimonas jatrophae]